LSEQILHTNQTNISENKNIPVDALVGLPQEPIKPNNIYRGDCVDLMKMMDDKSVNLIVTDPPYFLPAQHYNTRKKFMRNFGDLGVLEHFYKSMIVEYVRILNNDGSLYLFCDGQSYPLFYYHLYPYVKNLRPIIWDKLVSYNGYGWRHQHELIIWAEMQEAKQIPTGDGDIIKCRAVKVDERQHPAQKPIDLLKQLIEKSSNEGDLILDTFGGAGTTALACKELNRDYIIFENEPMYYELIKNNVASHKQKLTLL
jgi:site-specific DNA-methyltransferase (adenine-specific)